jgi:hypothetical protein
MEKRFWQWLHGKLKQYDSSESEIERLEEQISELKDELLTNESTIFNQQKDIECWKMRADNRTDQYLYWLNIAKGTFGLSEEEVLGHSKAEMTLRIDKKEE